MIVLDEQPLGSDLPARIKPWYQGTVTNILQLRPGSLIPDDAIPALLQVQYYTTHSWAIQSIDWTRQRE
jgi:hypothetical protein